MDRARKVFPQGPNRALAIAFQHQLEPFAVRAVHVRADHVSQRIAKTGHAGFDDQRRHAPGQPLVARRTHHLEVKIQVRVADGPGHGLLLGLTGEDLCLLARDEDPPQDGPRILEPARAAFGIRLPGQSSQGGALDRQPRLVEFFQLVHSDGRDAQSLPRPSDQQTLLDEPLGGLPKRSPAHAQLSGDLQVRQWGPRQQPAVVNRIAQFQGDEVDGRGTLNAGHAGSSTRRRPVHSSSIRRGRVRSIGEQGRSGR